MLSLFSPFAALSFATVVPYFLAMLQSESFDFTVCFVPLPLDEIFFVDEPLPLLEDDFFGVELLTLRAVETVRRGAGSSRSLCWLRW